MCDPLVSILMPVFNAQSYIRESVASILAQSFTDFELVAIDDGSSDASLSLLQSYAARDARIKAIGCPHRGFVATLNEGIRLCRGGLIARMDADDVSLPHRLELQVAYMLKHEDVVCLSGLYEYMDSVGRRLTTIEMPLDNSSIQERSLSGSPGLCHGCVIIRRKALELVGGYDAETEPAEDLDLWLRLGEVGRLANLPEVLLKVRLHDESMGARRPQEEIEKSRLVCERAWRRRNLSSRALPEKHWRPGQGGASRHEFLLRCGWWAFNSAERRTAIVYGVKAVVARPMNKEGWRLLLCAAVKVMPSDAGDLSKVF